MQVSTKRHACVLKYTHAADAQGNLTAVRMEVLADAGAYIDYTPVVMQRLLVHAAGPYRVPNVWLEGRAVLTNNPVAGAMRGFGVPQAVFACERQMDLLAKKLGMDPIDLRMKNVLKQGDIMVTGQKVDHDVGLREGLKRARQIIAISTLSSGKNEKSGWGIACFHYGNGRTGMPDPAVVSVSLLEDGKVLVSVGSPDIGQGSNTILSQIAAEALGMEIGNVSLISADTRKTMDSGTTSGTRVTVIVGMAVQKAAGICRRRILKLAAEFLNESTDQLRLERNAGNEPHVVGNRGVMGLREIYRHAISVNASLEVTARYDPPTVPLDENGQGRPYSVYSYGIMVAGVGVNRYTGTVNIKRLVSILNAGQVVNPVLFEGQVEGGVAMGLGYTFLEEIQLKEGLVLNPNFNGYLLPTSLDVTPVECITLPISDRNGPFGAKGIGEPSILPVAPAIVNAVSHATGVQYYRLPLSLEEVTGGGNKQPEKPALIKRRF